MPFAIGIFGIRPLKLKDALNIRGRHVAKPHQHRAQTTICALAGLHLHRVIELVEGQQLEVHREATKHLLSM